MGSSSTLVDSLQIANRWGKRLKSGENGKRVENKKGDEGGEAEKTKRRRWFD